MRPTTALPSVVVALALALPSTLASCDGAPEPGASATRAHPFHDPAGGASAAFWERWGDGRAELASYRGTVMRYGAPREAEVVLVYVTEPLDSRTLIKDDAAPSGRQLQTLKLNAMLRFQTGIYPYSVMTSTFAPVEAFSGLPRFGPAKITLTAQDWCGHVFAGAWREPDALALETRSYFADPGDASEGDTERRVELPRGALFEDALFVQLRELDGRFLDRPAAPPGTEPVWEGSIVPSLWSARRDHRPVAPERGAIRVRLEPGLVIFEVEIGARTLTLRVTDDAEHAIAGWETSDGDRFTLAGRERLPYWELHDPGEERERARLGLPEGLELSAGRAR
jgi:hypothetical protein